MTEPVQAVPAPWPQAGERLRLGVTGGIGSGKTFVAQRLHERYGIPVYNSDREAQRLMTAQTAIRQSLIALLGEEAYLSDGQLNKELMKAYLFSAPDHAAAVNAIVHPAVGMDFARWAGEYRLTPEEAALQSRHFQRPVVAVESALLVEARITKQVDCVLVVEAPLEVRIQRTMQRDGATEEAVRQRIARQLTDEQRRRHAHYVLCNDGQTDLDEQLRTFIDSIKDNNYIL